MRVCMRCVQRCARAGEPACGPSHVSVRAYVGAGAARPACGMGYVRRSGAWSWRRMHACKPARAEACSRVHVSTCSRRYVVTWLRVYVYTARMRSLVRLLLVAKWRSACVQVRVWKGVHGMFRARASMVPGACAVVLACVRSGCRCMCARIPDGGCAHNRLIYRTT